MCGGKPIPSVFDGVGSPSSASAYTWRYVRRRNALPSNLRDVRRCADDRPMGDHTGAVTGSEAGAGNDLRTWVAEGTTAAALIAAGLGLMLGWSGAPKLYLISIGALIYTVINSAGFFAQRKQWAMVALFAVLLILSAVSIPFAW